MSNNKASNLIPVTFLHPRGGKEFAADIDLETTGQKAMEGMIAAKFIEPSDTNEVYALQITRTAKSVPLNASIVASGAKANDTIAVVAVSAGAGN